MNLFFLDIDPQKCAEYHCDKHVIKMLLEIVQMLYTAHHLGKIAELPIDHYKIAHTNHPTAVWIRTCKANYTYASQVGMFLAKEYTFRYNKIHSCEKHIIWLNENLPKFNTNFKINFNLKVNCKQFEELGMTPVPLAMPDDSKRNDPIKSYREYYMLHKVHFAKWKKRESPWWYTSLKRITSNLF
jgi:hypothetical protein